MDKIAFTGSTDVGRSIRRATAGSGKRLSLELGGKSPFVVFDDADLDSVVEGVVDAIWFNQGQVCCAGSRLLVQENIAERLYRQAARAHGEAARGRPAGQGGGHRRDRRRRCSLRRSSGLVEQGVDEGATMLAAVLGLPDRGLLLPADALHQRRARRARSPRSRSSARCWSR